MTALEWRQWLLPAHYERITWDALIERVRQMPTAESALIVPDAQIRAAINRAVDVLKEHIFRRERWTFKCDVYPSSGVIQLPWPPTGVVTCHITPDVTGSGTWRLGPDLYRVDGQCWTWVQGDSTWPAGPQFVVLDVLGKPVGPELESEYCTVPLTHLWPLLESEVNATRALLDKKDPDFVMERMMSRRPELIRAMPQLHRPPLDIQGNNISWMPSVFRWTHWGQDDFTFEELP